MKIKKVIGVLYKIDNWRVFKDEEKDILVVLKE